MNARSVAASLFVAVVVCSASANASTATVVKSFPSSFPSPDGLAWDGAFLWATDCSFDRIDKIDPVTGSVVSNIVVTGINSDELLFDGTSLWISDHTATEMPAHGAPPPRLYKIDSATGAILQTLDAPGMSAKKYPMGMAWDGTSLWNIDTNDRKIHRIDPSTGAPLDAIPSPAAGACGMVWDGACLWVSDASTNGKIYHLDPKDGRVLSSFPGPGGVGHQSTGLAWDGKNLWNHDEQSKDPRIFQLSIDDPTESGACVPKSLESDAGSSDDAGWNDDASPSSDASNVTTSLDRAGDSQGCACRVGPTRRTTDAAWLAAVPLAILGIALGRRSRSATGQQYPAATTRRL